MMEGRGVGSEAFVGTDTMPVVHTWDCSSFFQEVTDTCVAIPISQEKKAEVKAGYILSLGPQG